eukprot:jgi/Botrbrau1/3670/Bobra.0008s0004.2
MMVLHLLSTRTGTLLLCGPQKGRPRSFAKLTVEERERILQKWAKSAIPELNKGAKGLKSLLMLTIFRSIADGKHPLLAALRYPGPDPHRPAEPAQDKLKSEGILMSALLNMSQLADADSTAARALLASKGLKLTDGPKVEELVLECDAVVVGSGAGGGVAAGVLAQAGMKVVVLEKGQYTPTAELTLQEGHAFESMYERAGVGLGNTDMSMNLLAGATVGGGTRINWCASFPTPEHVRREWAEEHGLENFASYRFTRALDAVCKAGGVYVGIPEHSRHNACLAAGLKEMGVHCGEIPRNCPNSKACGHCSLGCASGEKQDVSHTFLVEAARHGAIILTGVFAEKVLTTKVRSKGASSRVMDDSNVGSALRKQAVTGVLVNPISAPVGRTKRGHNWRLVVKAPIVVSAGGSLHTPAFLLRSNITCNGNVGKYLHLHPATVVHGLFPKGYKGQPPPQAKDTGGSMQMWTGGMMSTFSNEIADWEGSGYGPMLMTPSSHAGGWAGTLPWSSGKEYKTNLLKMADTSPVLVIVRDRDSGHITIDKEGLPVIHYWPSAFDRESLLKGMVFGMKALVAAGAEEVGSYQGMPPFNGLQERDSAAFDAYLDKVRQFGVNKHKIGVMSAHQMGSARMGSSPSKSVCDGEGECWQTSGLFIADASAFPSPTGINPMMTVEAIAYMVAEGICARWKDQPLPDGLGQAEGGFCSTLLEAANATSANKLCKSVDMSHKRTKDPKKHESIELSYNNSEEIVSI